MDQTYLKKMPSSKSSAAIVHFDAMLMATNEMDGSKYLVKCSVSDL